MTFGEDWGWGASMEESRLMFDAFVAAGGNFIDTANNYTSGTSEKYVGELIARERDRFVLATKYTLSERPDDPNAGGNHRKNLARSLEGSLRRLGTDYIDLYWVHIWDFTTPVEEVMRVLDDMVRAGKILHVGISDTPAWIVSRANTLAALKGWSPFVGLQIEYSLVQRAPERDLLPMAETLDIAVTPWGALGGGVLTGKYNREGGGATRPAETRFAEGEWGAAYLTERNLRIAAEVGKLAREMDRSPSQIALSWVRQQERGVMVPILGARKLSQLHDNLGSLDLVLSPEQLSRLDEVSRIELGFPHDFAKQPFIQQLIFGETHALIDHHRRCG
jgi:aryl-alcohol dehydrogenase-like predicted oxidoreductase